MFLRTKKERFTIKVKRGNQVGTFETEPLTPEEDLEIQKNHSDYQRVMGQLMPDNDYVEMRVEKIQKVVKSWDVKDPDTNEVIPCTNDNKRAMYMLNPDIFDEVLEKTKDMTTKAVQKKAATKKNS